MYALIEHNGALLLERRVDAPVWSLIAGRVEDDETLIEGLAREVREETGRFFAPTEIAELDVPATQLEVLRRFREEPTRLHLE